MKIKQMPMEELELLSHNDLTYHILKEEKNKMTTPEIFKIICDLFEYSEQYFFDAIADYFTSLNMDKRFKLINGIEWDLSENYPSEKEVDDEEEEIDEELDVDEEYSDEDLEDDFVDDEIDDDKEEDELASLTIINEEELND